MAIENLEDKSGPKSGSQLVLEYLRSLPPSAEFTSSSICEALEGQLSSSGVVTGFLAKLRQDGKIRTVGLRTGGSGSKFLSYEAVDLDSVIAKRHYSRGGKIGRKVSATTGKAQLAGLLLEIAAGVENLRGDLSDFTTHELLREIEKRTRG